MTIALFLGLICLGCGSEAPRTRDVLRMPDSEKRTTIEKMLSEYREEYADVPELSVSELVDLMAKKNVLLVDVRTPSEQAVSMIPGAVPRAVFENEKKKHEDQTIVTYCTIGYRSGKYARELREEAFRVFNLHGSVLAWTHAGRPMVDSRGAETKRVHVYGAEWNLLPEGYTPVW